MSRDYRPFGTSSVCSRKVRYARHSITPMQAAVPDPYLALPKYVWPRLGSRAAWVLDHGFDPRTVGAEWWQRELAARHLAQSVTTFDHDDKQRLTRSDLFCLGAVAAQPEAKDDDLLTFLWHVLAWGTGSGQRGNRQRVAAFADPEDRQRNVALLRAALHAAAEGDPGTAYSTLIRPGRAAIRGLGPAFFTKALYFASEGTAGTRCLILDARVAGNLYAAGWTSLPHRGTKFTYNWFTFTYVAYCELLQHWAGEATKEVGVRVWPDEIERALFEGPQS